MNSGTFLKKLGVFLVRSFLEHWRLTNTRPKISLLIPFASKDPVRKKSLQWLLDYWQHEIPDAEIIIGHSKGDVFCKGEALNNAAQRATGEIFVILDADAYISGEIITKCADRIIHAAKHGHRMWFVPYRNLYRLRKEITQMILLSDPCNPLRIPTPPPDPYIENHGDKRKYGHRYGAMIMMFPRRAYYEIGCFDERFKGWGGEDIALLRALDTLYGKHKTTNNDILHLWHPTIGEDYRSRMWPGQTSGNVNGELANKYHRATRHPSKMKELIEDSITFKMFNSRE